MSTPDPRRPSRTLGGPETEAPHRGASEPRPDAPWIKICGVRTLTDVEACAAAGATHVGINVWSGSPRHVRWDQVPVLIDAARASAIRSVLLVVPPLRIDESCLGKVHPDYLQVWQIDKARSPGGVRHSACGIIETRRINRRNVRRPCRGDVLLIDAGVRGRFGGTGERIPVGLALEAPRPFVLAGGLTPSNVISAILECAPAGVDAASGLESAPGRKDRARIIDFCAFARYAFRRVNAVRLEGA